NTKTLVALGIAVAVMGAIVLVRNQSQQPASILEQVSLQPLVPEGLTAEQVTRLELYAGDAPDARVVLTRAAGSADEWRVASHFDAPVDTAKIREYLNNAVGL